MLIWPSYRAANSREVAPLTRPRDRQRTESSLVNNTIYLPTVLVDLQRERIAP
jgi:hypothetical protein